MRISFCVSASVSLNTGMPVHMETMSAISSSPISGRSPDSPERHCSSSSRFLLVSWRSLSRRFAAFSNSCASIAASFNTVRLQLIRNQAEVHVLKSLGATDTEVGRPTLWWSVSLALVAFGLAYAVVSGAMGLADDAAGTFIREFDRDFRFEQPSGITALGLVLVWVVLVMVGAWASVKSTVLRIH